MQIHFFDAGNQSGELQELESRLRARLPDLHRVSKIEELVKKLQTRTPANNEDRLCILFPVSNAVSSFERLTNIVANYSEQLFFIFISDEISATDYKRLVRAGADWASVARAPEEVLEALARA